jgi:DNA-binding MarR family transcriptional regulator
MSNNGATLRPMHIVLQILATAQKVEKAGQRIFKPHGLSVAQFNALNLLSVQTEGMCASDIAAALVVDPSNITGLLNRMTRAGLLKELENPADGRQRLVTLSAKGRRLWQQAYADYQEQLQSLDAILSASERKTVERVLDLIATKSRYVEQSIRS